MALIAVAVPALAIEQRPENRGAATNITIQSKILNDALASAEQISMVLSQSGYRADFTLESLKQVDRFFEEQVTNGKPKPGGLLSQQLGARLFALGAYVGEVIRRHDGGHHAQASRRPLLLSTSRLSGGSHSPRKPASSAAGVSSTATSS